MGWQAWATLGTLALIVGVLVTTHVSTDVAMVGGVTLLVLLGILKPAEAAAGFGNESLLTVGILFVVVAGLRETGALTLLGQRLLGWPRSTTRAQARLAVAAAGLSSFIYNQPLVAMLLPVVDDWARKNRIPLSKVMLPLSYATILGGTCTLIGSSTNLIVNGLMMAQTGRPSLGLFDPTWVGLPCAVLGIGYLLIAGRWLLPDRHPVLGQASDPRQYTVEMLVEPGSGLVGQTIEQARLRNLPGLYLVEIDRDGTILAAVGPQERIRAYDRLVFAGVVESVVDLQKIRGLKPATDQVFKLDAPRSRRCLIEAVVSDSCPLVGRTIREGRFRTVYNAAVIAVARNGERVRGKIGDITVRPGDTLLLEAHPSFVDERRNSRDFFLVSRVENSTPPRHERAGVAAAILTGMVLAVGLGWLSMFSAALLAAGLMVLTRCCWAAEARQSVDWQVLVVMAAALGLGQAMQSSKAAPAIARLLIGTAGTNPWIALAAVYAVTMVFSELMTHVAAVAIVFPIAVASADHLGVSLQPFLIAILMAASCCFATPIGYATNLMVSGPGGYRFRDYLVFGGPLNLLIGAATVALTPWVWPFNQ